MQIVVWENTDRPAGQPAVFTANLATRDICANGGTARAAVGQLVRWLKMSIDTTNDRVGSADAIRQFMPLDPGYPMGGDVQSTMFPTVVPGGESSDATLRAKAVADPVAFLRSFPVYAEQYDDNGETDDMIRARVIIPPDQAIYPVATARTAAMWAAAVAFDFPNLPTGWEIRQFTASLSTLPPLPGVVVPASTNAPAAVS